MQVKYCKYVTMQDAMLVWILHYVVISAQKHYSSVSTIRSLLIDIVIQG